MLTREPRVAPTIAVDALAALNTIVIAAPQGTRQLLDTPSAVISRLTKALTLVALTVPRARRRCAVGIGCGGGTRGGELASITRGTMEAETLSVDANTAVGAVLGAAHHLGAVGALVAGRALAPAMHTGAVAGTARRALGHELAVRAVVARVAEAASVEARAASVAAASGAQSTVVTLISGVTEACPLPALAVS